MKSFKLLALVFLALVIAVAIFMTIAKISFYIASVLTIVVLAFILYLVLKHMTR